MLTEESLKGIYVPIITPFDSRGRLDLESFHQLTAHLISSGIDGLVVNGTTGESPTVTASEVASLTKTAQNAMQSARIPLVIGTGTNDTATTVKKTDEAGRLSADAVLVVVPYYNRPSQQGIIAHFRRVAEVGIPVILYDIPHRTGVSLTLDTVRTILDIDGVIGLKDSTGNLRLVTELSRLGSKPVLCGDDEQLFASLCCGAQGGMAASANIRAAQFVHLHRAFMAGQYADAKQQYDQLLPLIRLLFAEPNPAPLKWILAQQGQISSGELRLPLTPISHLLQHELSAYL